MEISFSAQSAWNLGLFGRTQLISWKKGSHRALSPQLGLCFYSRRAWKAHLTLIRSGKWEQSQNSFGRLGKSLAVADQTRSKGESADLSFRSQLSLSSASSSCWCPFHQLMLSSMGPEPRQGIQRRLESKKMTRGFKCWTIISHKCSRSLNGSGWLS